MKTARFDLFRSSLFIALLAASFLLQARASAGEYGEAFGLRLGMTIKEVRSRGVSLEDSGVSETWGRRYRTPHLPKEFGDERWIWLYFGSGDELIRIAVELADEGLAYESAGAIRRYRQIKGALSSKYALISAREPTRPSGKPCLNPEGAGTLHELNAAARKFYESALKSEGPHKYISMMHFCTIKEWTTTFGKSDTHVTVTVQPMDVNKKSSFAFIRVEVESQSLKEKFRREKSPL